MSVDAHIRINELIGPHERQSCHLPPPLQVFPHFIVNHNAQYLHFRPFLYGTYSKLSLFCFDVFPSRLIHSRSQVRPKTTYHHPASSPHVLAALEGTEGLLTVNAQNGKSPYTLHVFRGSYSLHRFRSLKHAHQHQHLILFDADGSGFFVDLKQISRRDDVSSSSEQGQDIVHARE